MARWVPWMRRHWKPNYDMRVLSNHGHGHYQKWSYTLSDGHAQWWDAMLCNHTRFNNNYIQIAGTWLHLLCTDKLWTFMSLVDEMHQTHIDLCDCPFRYLVVLCKSKSSRYEIFVFHIDAHIRFITNNYSTQHEEIALKKTVWLDVSNSEKLLTCGLSPTTIQPNTKKSH